jgi:hypothetical protein
VLGRKDTVARVGTRATILTYMKGRRDSWWRKVQLGDTSDPGLDLVRYDRGWELREPQLDLPVFSGTTYMCRWYMIGRQDELQGL